MFLLYMNTYQAGVNNITRCIYFVAKKICSTCIFNDLQANVTLIIMQYQTFCHYDKGNWSLLCRFSLSFSFTFFSDLFCLHDSCQSFLIRCYRTAVASRATLLCTLSLNAIRTGHENVQYKIDFQTTNTSFCVFVSD